jgi:hypothetical protein
VPKSFTLVALWAVFAVSSVSVGFAAAGLVGDPFTNVGTVTDASSFTGPGEGSAADPGVTPTDQATGSPTTPTRTPDAGAPTPTPTSSRPGATRSPDPAKPAIPASSPASVVTGGISTRGGYVSGTCRGGLVSVGAAPALYWEVDSITSGPVRTARVRLAPATDASGAKVDVTASCRAGNPVFDAENSDPGGGDESGGSGGPGGSSGPGGPGGSDEGGGDSSG